MATAASRSPHRPYPGSDLLRFSTAGSVDDGKSTLIGRLLHDSKGIFEDQLVALEHATRRRGGDGLDLALLTDGLRAEREQGITIDVAYRYFQTPRRKFIVADTPGHLQYTRNMVTGCSTADLSVILVDARTGVLEQTRRHIVIAALLRVPRLVVAVNKMDLVGFDEPTFRSIADEIAGFAGRLGVPDVTAIPVSALRGDNVVERSAAMPWFDGPPLLNFLESVAHDTVDGAGPLRLTGPVGHPGRRERRSGLPRLRRPDRGWTNPSRRCGCRAPVRDRDERRLDRYLRRVARRGNRSAVGRRPPDRRRRSRPGRPARRRRRHSSRDPRARRPRLLAGGGPVRRRPAIPARPHEPDSSRGGDRGGRAPGHQYARRRHRLGRARVQRRGSDPARPRRSRSSRIAIARTAPPDRRSSSTRPRTRRSERSSIQGPGDDLFAGYRA